ncbi:hypothetical protein LOK49_LG09G01631 [Camellia lanceoleosa]|uniref:Uncharacterized protein n=1 Tax=Camellia lanceoleosa TaxID=1840588 RepID=A0ACC0GGB7_9ERIC|nr:hypothetical protein LOK49_LG09G01631 [Camellia lanceoleosa]
MICCDSALAQFWQGLWSLRLHGAGLSNMFQVYFCTRMALSCLGLQLSGMLSLVVDVSMVDSDVEVLGVPLKVDINTVVASRRKYARVCVEVELRKPLVSQFTIGKNTYITEYEHLHSVCFSCGRERHVKHVCTEIPTMEADKQRHEVGREGNQSKEDEAQTRLGLNSDTKMGEPSQVRYGPWMKVTNQKRNMKGPRPQKGNTIQQRNRFSSLQEEENHSTVHKAHRRKNKEPMSLTQQEQGFRYKERTKGLYDSRGKRESPLDKGESKSGKAKITITNREEIRWGKKGMSEESTRSHGSEVSTDTTTPLLNLTSNIVALIPHNSPSPITPTNPLDSTHTISSISTIIREDSSRSRSRKPPNKNG